MSPTESKAVFLSYASQDAEAARRIAQALRGEGIEVWLDAEGGLEHGDEWDAKIRRQIKECVLFIPIISAHTQARPEGYFRIEWELAAQRAMGIASGIAFILPVVIDETREPDALVPDRFRTVQWTRLVGGAMNPEVRARYLKLWSHRIGALKPVAPKARDDAGGGVSPADGLEGVPVIAPPIPQRSIPLVGRAAELVGLRQHLERLAAGRGGTVLLGGEPGVGKTRLAEAVLQEAYTRGWLCVVGHSYEMEGTPAYTPVIEQLEQLARALPAPELRAVLGDAAPEIARFFPGLRRLLPDVGLPMELPPEQQRPYLHARFREYVERLAARGPVVVLADDLHWADESSLLLLEALAPRLATLPVLIVGTYRDVELEIGRPFAAVLERLTRQRRAERVAVRRLPEADVAALLTALGGSPAPAGLVHAIQHETEGNPFFVEEVFAHLKEEGRLFDAAGGWRTDLSLAELEVPEGVKLVLGRRLARVAESTRTALMVAAVIGPRFLPRIVEQAAGLSGDAVLDALDEAERAGLVRQLGGTRDVRYGFAHELIRHTLLSGLSGPRRQRWHLKIADAMERLFAVRLDEHAADLAYHLYEAGAAVESTRAIGASLRAAEQAVTAGAFVDALAHVERALSLEPEAPAQCADLLRLQCFATRGLGRWADASRYGELALRLYEQLGRREYQILYVYMAEMYLWQGELVRMRELFRARQRDDVTPATNAAILAWTGFAEGSIGRDHDATVFFDSAQTLVARVGDRATSASVDYTRGVYLGHRGRIREAVGLYESAAEAFLSLGQEWNAAPALSHVVAAYNWLGRFAEAQPVIRKALGVADHVGHVGANVHVAGARWMIDWACSGDLPTALKVVEACVARFRPTSPALADGAILYLHWLRFYAGEWTESLDALNQIGRVQAISTWDHVFWAYPFWLKAYRGDGDALALLEKHREQLPKPGAEHVLGTWLLIKPVIEGLVVLGRRDQAASLYEAAVSALEHGFVTDHSGAFETSTALAAAAVGRWDVAERHFENSLHTVDAVPHILGQGETRRWYAWMCLERGAAGDVEKALGLLDGAQRVYERIGMPKHLELVRALRERAGQRR